MSRMRTTLEGQSALLSELSADPDPAARAAERLAGRRVWLCGTGTSWHAANHGAWFLHTAGIDARALQAADAAAGAPGPAAGDGLLLLSHSGGKRYALEVLERARAVGAECVVVGARGREGVDVPTSEREQSSAYTASHLAAMFRLAQIAEALGAGFGALDVVPSAVAAAVTGPPPGVPAPARLLEFTGAGANQWTAAEGALKVREASRIATEGLAAEQLLHGPAVALGGDDVLVTLDGGGPLSARLETVAGLAEVNGARVHRIGADELGEPLSVFMLTVAVQRVALTLAEQAGTDPDAFGYDVPGRKAAWEAVEL